MSQIYGHYSNSTAINAAVDDRASFLVRTYLHLTAAVFLFVGLEAFLFLATDIPAMFFRAIAGSRFMWFIVLGAFMASGYMARSMARSSSPAMAYAGLGLYILAQAVIFMPLIGTAMYYSPGAIPTAGLITLVLFGGLTGVVFITRRDFSFLQPFLMIAAIGAMATIVCAMLFGFELGVFFAGAMVIVAGGYILFDTSKVLHYYRTDQHVAAALELFASLALLFWYVLRIVMASQRR